MPKVYYDIILNITSEDKHKLIYSNMIPENIKTLIKYIKYIVVENKEIKINPSEINIIEYKHKFSSQINKTVGLEINGKILNSRITKICYECPICHVPNKILMLKFLNKNSLRCVNCFNRDLVKREKQIKTWKNKSNIDSYDKFLSTENKSLSFLTTKELIKKSENSFSKENNDFKIKYFLRAPTKEEFEIVKNKILKFGDIEIKNKEIIYHPAILTSHSTKYSPKVEIDGKLYLLYYFDYLCEICEKNIVHSRNLKNKIKQKEFLCRGCYLGNKTFKFKKYKNIDNEIIIYQSNPELKLIQYCNNNGILIKNGPKLKYVMNGKIHEYKVDFEIPELKWLIEIKDMHIWHKNEILSGKWDLKKSAAIEYCEFHNYNYKLEFDVDILIDNIKRVLLRGTDITKEEIEIMRTRNNK